MTDKIRLEELLKELWKGDPDYNEVDDTYFYPDPVEKVISELPDYADRTQLAHEFARLMLLDVRFQQRNNQARMATLARRMRALTTLINSVTPRKDADSDH